MCSPLPAWKALRRCSPIMPAHRPAALRLAVHQVRPALIPCWPVLPAARITRRLSRSARFRSLRQSRVVSVAANGGPYSGSSYAAAAQLSGAASLESVTPALVYYTGSTVTGTAMTGAPVHAGTYTVVASFAGSSDYASAQSAAVTFTIAPVPLTITANSLTMDVGGPLPAFTASYDGFVSGDSPASLTPLPTLSTTATVASLPAGSPYPITASGAVDPDYTISYVAGSLTIVQGIHAPQVTNATVVQNSQSTSGLVITPQPADVGSVTNYQITAITGGTLYLSDGTTPVVNGQFITVAQAAAGLRFSPSANSSSPGSFQVESATGADAADLAGPLTTATISVMVNPPTSSVATMGDRTSDVNVPVSWSGNAGTGGAYHNVQRAGVSRRWRVQLVADGHGGHLRGLHRRARPHLWLHFAGHRHGRQC